MTALTESRPGRKLWETMSAYWPTADQQPGVSPAEIEFARLWQDTTKVVFSSTIDMFGLQLELAIDLIRNSTPRPMRRSTHREQTLPDRFDDVGWRHMCQLIADLTAALEADPRIQLAIVFGSVARGTANPDSDVDITYVPEPDAVWSLRDELELEGELASVAGREVDLVRFDQAALPLRWRIVRDGTVLLARSPDARRLIAKTALEYLDLEPLLEASGRTYLARLAHGARSA